jgi:flagellar motor switch protein FliM
MTTSETVTNIDFTAPPRLTGTAHRALAQWNGTATAVLQEFWQALLGNRITLEVARTDSSLAQKAQQALPDPGCAALLKIGPDRFDCMVAFSNRIVLTLVSEMLGTLGEEWPVERELTPAELSLVELLFGEIARAFSQGWPEVEALPVELNQILVRPLRSRVFQPRENLIRSMILVQTPAGEEALIMLMPQAGLASIGIEDTATVSVPRQSASPQIRALTETLPVTMSVSLGKASLSLGEMNQLAVGDVLILDQPVGNPLEANISGHLHFLGHACRLGQRQGFRVLVSKKD